MLLTAAPLFFAVIADAATPFFPNATTSSTSSTSLGNDPTITPSAYYNPAAFVNPYFFILINTSGDLVWSSLRSCGSIWASSFTRWLGTAEVSTGPIIPATTQTTTWLPWISTSTGSMETVVTTILPKTFTSTVPAQGPLYYVPDYLDFTASEPCCYSCTLYGGNVQVYYWPEKTQSPPISTLVNSAGFTLYVLNAEPHYSFFYNLISVSLRRYMLPLNRYTRLIYVEMWDRNIQLLHFHSHQASSLPPQA